MRIEDAIRSLANDYAFNEEADKLRELETMLLELAAEVGELAIGAWDRREAAACIEKLKQSMDKLVGGDK